MNNFLYPFLLGFLTNSIASRLRGDPDFDLIFLILTLLLIIVLLKTQQNF